MSTKGGYWAEMSLDESFGGKWYIPRYKYWGIRIVLPIHQLTNKYNSTTPTPKDSGRLHNSFWPCLHKIFTTVLDLCGGSLDDGVVP